MHCYYFCGGGWWGDFSRFYEKQADELFGNGTIKVNVRDLRFYRDFWCVWSIVPLKHIKILRVFAFLFFIDKFGNWYRILTANVTSSQVPRAQYQLMLCHPCHLKGGLRRQQEPNANHKIHVSTAFLNAELHQLTYLSIPDGMVKLTVSKSWYNTFDGTICHLGFVQSKADRCSHHRRWYSHSHNHCTRKQTPHTTPTWTVILRLLRDPPQLWEEHMVRTLQRINVACLSLVWFPTPSDHSRKFHQNINTG